MKEMLVQTASVYGKRNSLSKRKAFLSLFSEQIRRLGFNVQIDEGYTSIKKYSAVYGTPKDASAIFVTGYDTGSAAILPNHRYYPLHIRKSAQNDLIDLWIRILIGGLLLLLVYYLTKLPFIEAHKIFRYGLILLFVVSFFFLLRGIGCKYNFNRNTAAIVTLYEAAEALKGNKKYAFVYADDTMKSPIGYKRVSKVLGPSVSNIPVIIVEAVGSGEKLYLAHRKSQDEEAKRILSHFKGLDIEDVSLSDEEAENSVLGYFAKTFILTSGEMSNGQIVCTKTRSYASLECDIDRLEMIRDGIVSLVEKR